MLTKFKILGGAALSLLISGIFITPIDAKPATDISQNIPDQIAQAKNDTVDYELLYPVGIIRTIEGDTVYIQQRNGVMKTYQLSSDDMNNMKLASGSYVLIDEENNRILDVVYEGEIRSIVGTVVTVELANGDLEKYGVSRGELGAMNLIEGQDVYVTESQIVGLAPEPDLNTEAYLINSVRPTQTDQQTQVQVEPAPTQPMVENNQSRETEIYQQDNNQTQPDFQAPQVDEPVRGMW